MNKSNTHKIYKDSNSKSFILLSEDNEPNLNRIQDGNDNSQILISWSWVTVNLATAINAWYGRSIFERLFERRGITVLDLKKLVSAELKLNLKSELSDIEINTLDVHFTNVFQLLEDYGKTGGVHRLDKADVDSIYIQSVLIEHTLKARNLYAASLLLRISILQTYIVDRLRDERKNIVATINNNLPLLNELFNHIKKTNKTDFDQMIITYKSSNPGDGNYVEIGYTYLGISFYTSLCYNNQQECFQNAKEKVQQLIEEKKKMIVSESEVPIQMSIKVLSSLRVDEHSF